MELHLAPNRHELSHDKLCDNISATVTHHELDKNITLIEHKTIPASCSLVDYLLLYILLLSG